MRHDPKTWIQAHSGRPVDLLRPKPDQIYMGDIAHALARIPRFTGHTLKPWPVAMHAVNCYRIARRISPDDHTAALWALLHDGHEAYLGGDLSTPFKNAFGLNAADSAYERAAARFDELIGAAVGISRRELAEVRLLVKRIDFLALAAEREAYMAHSLRPWGLKFAPSPVPVPAPRSAEAAERLFGKTLGEAAALRAHGRRRAGRAA